MYWTPLYEKKPTNNINKTSALLQTNRDKDETNIVFMRNRSKLTNLQNSYKIPTGNQKP